CPREDCGLVSGPHGVRPARAGEQKHSCRPAPQGHERDSQQPRQVSRALPAVRSVDSGGEGERVFRDGLPIAIHGDGVQNQAEATRAYSGGDAWRRDRQVAVSGARRESAVLEADSQVRGGDWGAGAVEHVLQCERAHRANACPGDRLLPADANGRIVDRWVRIAKGREHNSEREPASVCEVTDRVNPVTRCGGGRWIYGWLEWQLGNVLAVLETWGAWRD